MSKLKNAIVYLAGPIDCAKDLGIDWRKRFVELAKPLGLKILNPCDKPPNCAPEVKDGHRIIDNFRRNADWTGLQKFAKTIRREDLRFVDLGDFLVIYINMAIYTCGSFDELFTAERQQKPVLAIVEGGLAGLPSWCFAVFNLAEVFDSVEACVAYLDDLDKGRKEMDKRWFLVRDYLETIHD